MAKTVVLGGGITGLVLGSEKGYPVYEKNPFPGGICASYYMGKDGKKHSYRISPDTYRFEIGGGHWIFGVDDRTIEFLRRFSRFKKYSRKSAVFIPKLDKFIPYPLQYNLSFLPAEIRGKIIAEIESLNPAGIPKTLSEWLEKNFGHTLCNLFFFPFHNLYTAGLFTSVSSQDMYKTPFDKRYIRGGVPKTKTGYNAEFLYPEQGLDSFIRALAEKTNLLCGKEAIKIDLDKKEILFSDGTMTGYDKIISTLPLNRTLKLAGIELKEPFAYTSVLEVNIGGERGKNTPFDHWAYFPGTKSGFFRLGFYSNVDKSFLPKEEGDKKISVYAEKAFRGGRYLSLDEQREEADNIIAELTELGFISSVDVSDYTFIDVAYTWEYPGSLWREKAISALQESSIYPLGRFGLWKFQGIAKSITDALNYNV